MHVINNVGVSDKSSTAVEEWVGTARLPQLRNSSTAWEANTSREIFEAPSLQVPLV